jgi:hypothetical protein
VGAAMKRCKSCGAWLLDGLGHLCNPQTGGSRGRAAYQRAVVHEWAMFADQATATKAWTLTDYDRQLLRLYRIAPDR